MEGLNTLNLRELSYDGRVNIIKEQVKDIAFRELLYKMLEDKQRRPTAEQLLEDISVRFFGYITEELHSDLQRFA